MTSVFLLLPILVSSLLGARAEDLKLKYVTIVFRHGDRAPDILGIEGYPTDPNLDYHFFPEGIGGLTNSGKRREFLLGETIRRHYGKFLGDIYSSSEIIARSTDYERTKMSLQLVLAAVYPPSGPQKWNPGLNWQPVVTNYVASNEDVLMIPEECPQYLKEFERVKKLPNIQEKIHRYSDFMKNLTEWTGKPISLPNDMFNLYHALMAETSMGLKIPDWAHDIFPYGLLLNGTILEYEIVSYNKMLKKLNGGALLKNITETMVNVVMRGSKRKMTLLSGHETNIAALLQTLSLYTPHVPEYSSAIFFELLEGDDDYYVRVQYYLGIPSKVVEKTIPGCTAPCPLADFITLLDDVIPSDEDLVCEKPLPTDNTDHWKNILSVAELVRRKSNQV